MSARNLIVSFLAVSTLLFLSACGSSSNSASAPPTGGFSASNFNGTYVFSFSGADFTTTTKSTTTGSFFAAAGTLVANGSGGLTATIDMADPQLAVAVGVAAPYVLTGVTGTGSYKVTADGRGSGTVNISVNGTTLPLGIDFVLSSSSGGFITRFDQNGTGSGTLGLQTSGPTLGTAYAFSLSGIDGSTGNPAGAVGEFSIGAGGALSGLMDVNDFNLSTGNVGVPITGTITLGASGAAGTASITGSTYGTLNFDVWPIDSTHLKLVETDGIFYAGGDAFTQQTTISSGQLVYTMSGLDDSTALLASGGFFTYDGSSAISSGFEAVNDLALTSIAQSTNVSGTLTTTGTSGRYVMSLTGFYNGSGGAVTNPVFAAYPSASGILLLEIDGGGVTAGTAFSQTSTTFTAPEGYGLNLTGENSDGEVDDIAEFTANSGGTLTNGDIDENDSGSLQFDQQLGSGGAFAVAGTGYGSISYPATNITEIGTLNLGYFVVNSNTTLIIDTDAGGQTGVGALEDQSSSSATAGIAHTVSHFAALRASVQRSHLKK